MKLVIQHNKESDHWEVSSEGNSAVIWEGPLRRDAFFYCRDREDDPSDEVDDIVIFDRDGNITYGFTKETTSP